MSDLSDLSAIMNHTGVRTVVVPQAAGVEHSFVARHHLATQMVTALLVAFALHHFVFRKGEWHLKAPAILEAWVLSYPILYSVELIWGAKNLVGSATNTMLTMACFTVALLCSIAAYRLAFHQLTSFPGPKLAAVSKLWHSYQCLGAKNHRLLADLNRQYGDYVRTGPNEITIFNPDALIKLDGPGNKTTKSTWYDFMLPEMGVTTIRDKALHDERRKIWTQAFSGKALPVYEYQMAEHAEELEKLIRVAAEAGKPLSFTSLAYWFSFDVMGMFVLSESFNMISNEDWHFAVGNLRRAMKILGPLSPVPWLAQIGFKYLKGYWIVKDWHSMIGWCRERMQQHTKCNNEGTNVASYLIADAVRRDSVERDHHLLTGEAVVAIVAGSDTVAPTLIMLFYELASHPDQADRLYEELQGVDVTDRKALEELPHLNGLITETLRLHPAVPTGGNRDTPPEGMMIGGRYIPGNTTIVAPRYSIFRSAECYEEPKKFVPERWYSRPEMVKDSRSFRPFAQGRYTCVGKSLALSELRVVAALLVSKYHIHFPPGNHGAQVENDLKDQFTAAPGQLDLVFT